MKSPLEQAVALAGTASELVRLSKDRDGCPRFSSAQLHNWRRRGDRVPAEFCPDIERATLGRIRCEELRPDVDWAYLRGTASAATPKAAA